MVTVTNYGCPLTLRTCFPAVIWCGDVDFPIRQFWVESVMEEGHSIDNGSGMRRPKGKKQVYVSLCLMGPSGYETEILASLYWAASNALIRSFWCGPRNIMLHTLICSRQICSTHLILKCYKHEKGPSLKSPAYFYCSFALEGMMSYWAFSNYFFGYSWKRWCLQIYNVTSCSRFLIAISLHQILGEILGNRANFDIATGYVRDCLLHSHNAKHIQALVGTRVPHKRPFFVFMG